MFIGHFAVGFAAKRYAPRASLGVLIAAPIFLDLLWPLFLLAGVERARIDPGNTIVSPLSFDYYPWSHSLLMAGVWGMNFKHMPELDWLFGYPIALAVIAISAVVPLYWFRRRGWL